MADKVTVITRDNDGKLSPLRGRIFINGVEIKGVTDISVFMGVEQVTKVTIELFANVEIINDKDGKLPDG
jgi:hypothetical protein